MSSIDRRSVLFGAATLAGALATPGRAERVHSKRLSFDIEAKVPLSGLLTPTPLTFPPEIAPALAAGALEIRVRYRFPIDSRDMLAIQVFLAPPGAPYPLPAPPAATDPSTVAYFEMAVYDVLTVDKPNATVAMVGEIQTTTGSPFGDLTGVLSYASFQYLPGPPLRFRAVFGGTAGVITTNAPSGVGTLEWTFRMP